MNRDEAIAAARARAPWRRTAREAQVAFVLEMPWRVRPAPPAPELELVPEPEPPAPAPRARAPRARRRPVVGERAPAPLDELERFEARDDEPLGYLLDDDAPPPERAGGGWTAAPVDSLDARSGPVCARCRDTGVTVGTYSGAPLWRPCGSCGERTGSRPPSPFDLALERRSRRWR